MSMAVRSATANAVTLPRSVVRVPEKGFERRRVPGGSGSFRGRGATRRQRRREARACVVMTAEPPDLRDDRSTRKFFESRRKSRVVLPADSPRNVQTRAHQHDSDGLIYSHNNIMYRVHL